MITTDTAAWNEMCARIREHVESPAMSALLGYTPMLTYPDQKTSAPSNDKVRLNILQSNAGVHKRTLGQPPRITQRGIIEVEIWVPVGNMRAAEYVLGTSEIVKAAFASSTPNVDFMSAFIRNMPRDAQWYNRRIQATYSYDTRG